METVKKKLKQNQRDLANIFSVLVFSWVIPLFKEGYSKSLDIEDLFQSRQCDKSKILADRLQRYRISKQKQLLLKHCVWMKTLTEIWKSNRFWEQQQSQKKSAALLTAIAKTFRREYLILALLCLVNDVILKIVQPQLLRKFLLYFKYERFFFAHQIRAT